MTWPWNQDLFLPRESSPSFLTCRITITIVMIKYNIHIRYQSEPMSTWLSICNTISMPSLQRTFTGAFSLRSSHLVKVIAHSRCISLKSPKPWTVVIFRWASISCFQAVTKVGQWYFSDFQSQHYLQSPPFPLSPSSPQSPRSPLSPQSIQF